MWKKIRERLLFEGASEVGCAWLGEGEYPYAITILARIQPAVLARISNGPDKVYFHHYRTLNTLLDRCALVAAEMLSREGYMALPIAASQTVDSAGVAGAYSHKKAAARSGLGTMGKNAMFISDSFGSAVRLATVLTDCPLTQPVSLERPSLCADCDVCKNACPAGAISGRMPTHDREDFFDAYACSAYMKKAYRDIGRGAVCGLCMAACPHNQIRRK